MPITVSNMAAFQAMLNSQKAAIDVTVNAARDNVNANVDADAATLAGVVNAARDNVKADNVAQMATQTTAINSNTDTKTGAVTTAVNAKTPIKSIQRLFIGAGAQATIAAVDMAKSVLQIEGWYQQYGGGSSYTQGQGANFVSSTSVQNNNVAQNTRVTVIEYF